MSASMLLWRGLVPLLLACSICGCGTSSENSTKPPAEIDPGSASKASPVSGEEPPFPKPLRHLQQGDIRGELGRAWRAIFDGDPPARLRRESAQNGNDGYRWYPIESAPVSDDIYAMLVQAVPDHPDEGEGGMMLSTLMYLERAGNAFRLLAEHDLLLPLSRPIVHRRKGRSIFEFRRFSRDAHRECVETSFVVLDRTGPTIVARGLLLDYAGRGEGRLAQEVVEGRLAGTIALSRDGKQLIARHRGTVDGRPVDEQRSWKLGASPPLLRAIAPHFIDEQGYCIRKVAAAA